jgi:hypothetical protein
MIDAIFLRTLRLRYCYLNELQSSPIVANLVCVDGSEEQDLRVGVVGQFQNPEQDLCRLVRPEISFWFPFNVFEI